MRSVIKKMIPLIPLILSLVAIPVMAATTIQVPASGWDYLGGADSPATWSRLGQRLVLEDTEAIAIGYRLCRVGSPTGDITLSIRDSSTDHVIWSQVWGGASALPDANNSTYVMVDITPPLKVDGDVRICVEYRGGNATDYCRAGYYSGDKITGQWYTNYVNYATDVTGWHDIGEAEEGAYYMSYIGGGEDPIDGGDGVIIIGYKWWIMGAILGIVATVVVGSFLLGKAK